MQCVISYVDLVQLMDPVQFQKKLQPSLMLCWVSYLLPEIDGWLGRALDHLFILLLDHIVPM